VVGIQLRSFGALQAPQDDSGVVEVRVEVKVERIVENPTSKIRKGCAEAHPFAVPINVSALIMRISYSLKTKTFF
jgi:hypothetical protein